VIFNAEVIRSLGGFPVFYLPAPFASDPQDRVGSAGVSLLYRLAEVQDVLRKIRDLPRKYRRRVEGDVADFENLEGAMRFLGNILYMTDYLRRGDADELRYYRQREWRVIAHLSAEDVSMTDVVVEGRWGVLLSHYRGQPLADLVEEVAVVGDDVLAERIEQIVRRERPGLPVRLIRVPRGSLRS
jgi:hypothetical protein